MSRPLSALMEFVEHAGLSLFATLLTAGVVILIIMISWFWSPFYSIIENSHIFQGLVLLMFIELITLSIKRYEKNKQPTIFIEEIDAVNKLFAVVAEKRVRKARILSAGLGSRRVVIEQLIKDGVRVQCLVQDPGTAIDKRDAKHTLDSVQVLQRIAKVENANLLIRLNINVVAVRAILLYEPHDQARHLFVGWYTYENQNTTIYGSTNPTLYVSSDSPAGRHLCEWIERLMDSAENEAHDIPDDNTLSSTQHKI